MPKNILIVEDSQSQAETLRLILEMNGYATKLASSGEEALVILNAGIEFELVISDVVMPGMTGYELCRQVKARTPQLPIMLVTAVMEHTELLQCVRSGADAFLTKPYDPDILLARIRFLLRELTEAESTAMGFELALSDTEPIAEVSTAQLTNLLVTTLEDVSRTNRELNKKRDDLQGAQEKLVQYAQLVEKELGTTQQKLDIRNRATETLEQVILIVNSVGDEYLISDANAATRTVLGFKPEEIINTPLPISDTSPEGARRFRRLMTAARAADAPRTLRETLSVKHRDGSQRWCDFHVSVISKDPQGEFLFACTLSDVSNEHAIKLATEHLSRCITTNERYIQTAAKKIGEILNADTAFIAELKESEVHTRALWQSGKIVDNISYPLASAPCRDVISQGGFYLLENASESFPEFAYLERNAIDSYMGVRISTSSGKASGLLGIMCKKKILRPESSFEVLRIFSIAIGAELERARAFRQYENLFRFAPEAMIITDGKGELLLANENAEKLFKYESDELLSKNITDLFLPDTGNFDLDWLEEYRKAPFALRIDKETANLKCLSRSGQEFPVEVSLNPLDIGLGNTVALTIRDISEQLKHAQDRLARQTAEEANKAKSAFLATMSHEIRTPLNGVLGSAELLTQMPLEAEQLELAQTIHESGKGLLGVINDILDFSKIEAGKLITEREAFQLIGICERVCKTLSSVAVKKGVRLSLFVDPELPRSIIGDGARIRQILNNLVSNAIKFSASEARAGFVEVRIEQESAEHFLTKVIDNGIGISAEYQSMLFTPFTQEEAATTRRFGGTGLGLTICKRLCDLLGGEIELESEVDRGTSFTVRLPLEPAASASSDTEEVTLEELDCLLLCDRDNYSRDWERYLKHAGANVLCFNELEQANGTIANCLSQQLVVISALDREESKKWFRDLRLSQNINLLILQHTSKRAPIKAIGPSILLLEYPVLFRDELLTAVEITSGRREIPSDIPFAAGRLIPTIALPDRSTAIERGELILIAEDNPVNQTVVQKQLARLGYLSELADDGAQGLEAWLTGDFSLLITDLHMPVMDGYELTRAVRGADNGFRDRPIIALTANAMKGERDKCLSEGMNDYLSKPIGLIDLNSKLEQWLQVERKVDIDSRAASTEESEPDTGILQSASSSLLNYEELIKLVGDEEEMLNRLSAEFKRTLEQDKIRISSLDIVHDRAELANIAHRIKSSARMFGANEFAEICEGIELDGRSASGSLQASQLDNFHAYADRVLVELDENLLIAAAQ